MIPVVVVNPVIGSGVDVPAPAAVVYSTISPLPNPWFSNITLLYCVEIPAGLTYNFLLVKVPPSITSIAPTDFWLGKVENLCVPAVLETPKPTTLVLLIAL